VIGAITPTRSLRSASSNSPRRGTRPQHALRRDAREFPPATGDRVRGSGWRCYVSHRRPGVHRRCLSPSTGSRSARRLSSLSCSWPRARMRDTKGPRQPRALWGHSPGPIPKTFYSMRVIADTCRPGSETSRPVLGGAANDPEILIRDLFRSYLLRQFCYRWLLWIDEAPSDRCRARWHLDHVSLVK
jgi:hypothetical protein